MTQADPTWQSAHVYYYAEDKDALLLDAVRPLLDDLRPAVERAFVVRHWLRGPHLRLRFHASDQLFERQIRPALEQRLGGYLATRPSTALLDAEALLPIYTALAEQEDEQGPFVPLHPDNTIVYEPYDNRLRVLRRIELVEIIEDFYVETNPLLFAMLEAVRGGASRLMLSLALMFSTGHIGTHHISSGFLSFRSHAELFIIRTPEPAAVRAQFERQYAKHAPALRAQLQLVLETLAGRREPAPFVLEWAQLLRHYAARADALIALGAQSPLIAHSDLTPEQMQIWQARVQQSEFHRTREAHSDYWQHLVAEDWFQRYRLMVNLLYLHLSRLGVRPIERAMLGHFLANTVEATFGVSATELIGPQP
jgi:hypothetical protein